MRFAFLRKLAINWRLWRELRRERRRFARVLKKITDAHIATEVRLTAQREFYELRLAEARTRAELREDALVDRILNAASLVGVAHVTNDLTEIASRRIAPEDRASAPPEHPEHELGTDERLYFEQYRENFEQMGRDAGFSESDINLRWENEQKQVALDTARGAFMPQNFG